jgi:hypothetical protein
MHSASGCFARLVRLVLAGARFADKRKIFSTRPLQHFPFSPPAEERDQCAASVFASGRKAFFSRGCHGQIHSADVYVFDYGSDVAWWSNQGTAAVLVRPHDSPITEKAVQLLRENANAELVITPTWLVVRSRRRVSPDMLGRWATTVVDTLKNG